MAPPPDSNHPAERARIEVGIVDGIGRIDAAEWDALCPPDDPFIRHAFLACLEDSGSASAEAGWMPAHVVVRQGGRLVGASPAYVKHHSYGEYIFDWSWAQASQQAGVPYYPKVVSAVPFTPATGRRVLVAPDIDEDLVIDGVIAGMQHLCEAVEGASHHWLFCTKDEHDRLVGRGGAEGRPGPLIGRMTHQYHWENKGYDDFEHWLSHFRSKCRKEARRERRKAGGACDAVHILRGSEMGDREWTALRGFYEDTTGRKWGQAYLSRAFFALARERLGDLAMAWLAEHDGRYVAGALCFQAGKHLYGRYWGCSPGYRALHFELCYHGPIAACISHGWTRFEAGAQGQHKIQRGLLPQPTWSVHWLRHPGLAQAVRKANRQEAAMTHMEMAALAQRSPFKRG